MSNTLVVIAPSLKVWSENLVTFSFVEEKASRFGNLLFLCPGIENVDLTSRLERIVVLQRIGKLQFPRILIFGHEHRFIPSIKRAALETKMTMEEKKYDPFGRCFDFFYESVDIMV